MEAHYFTCSQLMDTLAEIEKTTDNKLFVKYIFSTIHYEVMKVAYLNVHSSNDTEHYGENVFMEGIKQAQHDAKNKILNFSYSINGKEDVALNLLNRVKNSQKRLDDIKTQSKETPFWQIEVLYRLWKEKQEILDEQISFSEIGSLLMYFYIQRGLGDSLSFRANLVDFFHKVGRTKTTPEKKKSGIKFKNPFRKSTPNIMPSAY